MLSQIKHYRIVREIGGGGFATVYLAQDENLKREVAIKVLHANLATDSDFRRFFEREAQLVAALEHLAVVPIYDYGETGGQLYLVMRYMRGGTLSDRLEKTRKALTLAEVIKLLERLAPTLDAIHARGVIHRDLKPSNILYDDAGSSYIADFGIARVQQATSRLTQTGISFGTPQYSSPEQVTGDGNLDHRSDIYTLGVIVYELLTGEYPFWSDTPLGWVYKHLEARIPNVRDINRKVPEGVQGVVEGMLAKGREDRYDSVEAVLTDLKRAESGQPILFKAKRSKAPSRTVPIARPNRPIPAEEGATQNRSTVAMAALAVIVVVALLGWVFLQNSGGGDADTARATTPPTEVAEEVAVIPATETATPRATSAPPPVTQGGTPTQVQATVPVALPTSTSLLDIPPAIVETAIPTVIATDTPLATSTPLVANTPTPSPTTALPTLTPTRTRTPGPTATRITDIAAPPTATTAATQAVLVIPITLLDPANDASFSAGDTITFRWQGGTTLQEGQYYDVRVWRDGAPHYGVVGAQTTQASINAGSLGTGTFFWSVAVVSNGGATTVVNEAPARQFTVSGGGGGDGGGNNGGGNPGPNPTVTAPPY